jgi:hypothetical protein
MAMAVFFMIESSCGKRPCSKLRLPRIQKLSRGAHRSPRCLVGQALTGGQDAPRAVFAARWHLSEQYFTSSQFFAQALRQNMGLRQWVQSFTGRSLFLRMSGAPSLTLTRHITRPNNLLIIRRHE